MRLMVSGFEPFGGDSTNPSREIALGLGAGPPPEPFSDCACLVLPTEYEDAAARLLGAVNAGRPDVLIMFGLAARSTAYRLERFALNLADCVDADNAGCVKRDAQIASDGPAALRTDLDLEWIANRTFALTGHAPQISNHAGTFVCNFVYYSVLSQFALSQFAVEAPNTTALFVHVPWAVDADGGAQGAAPLVVHRDVARGVIRATGEALSG